MRLRYLILLVIVLLAWSYFARPIYDFAWVVAGRIYDRTIGKMGSPTLRMERDSVVGRALGQGEEISAYLRGLRQSLPDGTLPAPDYASPEAFARSTELLRQRLRQSLRYPPPGFELPATDKVSETAIGEDEFARYTELRIPVLPGVHATGLLLWPKGAQPGERLPLVVSAAGRGGMPGSPADTTLPGMVKSRRDLWWEAVRRGWAVWVPTYVHYNQDGDDFRDRLTVRAWEAGTSLPAIEIAKTVRALDHLLARPDIDPQRVAMMGQSYGGFYTLYTSALDPRIRVAAIAAYFNDREAVLDNSEPTGFLDWRYPDSLSLFRDPTVAALVAPRPLLIASGNQDQLFPIEGARKAAPEVAQIYQRLGIPQRFEFRDFAARHDFDGKSAMDFIEKNLK